MALRYVSVVLLVGLAVKGASGDGPTSSNLRGATEPTQTEIPEAEDSTEMPDMSGLPDHPGPYEEEPSSADAKEPKPSMQNWNVEFRNSSGDSSFCSVHKTGYWCNDLTRVRCCKLQDQGGYAKCGSTANSSFCGRQGVAASDVQNSTNATLSASWWPSYGGDDSRRRSSGSWDDHDDYYDRRRRGGSSGGGGGWHLHSGWHTSSFCQSHHVGGFCSSHHFIHCCNDYGHYVECNSAYHDSSSWC